jgi:protein-tyrosine phosphatase
LISYALYLLHPLVIEVYHHCTWTRLPYPFGLQVMLAAGLLAIMIAVSLLTYLSVERPMQSVGRRVARAGCPFRPRRDPGRAARAAAGPGRAWSPGHRVDRPVPHAGVMALASAAELPSPREPVAPYRVWLVCLGNICRSPMAETVLRGWLAAAGLNGAVVVDSAGTGDWHVGDAMDPAARTALASRGHDGSAHRARQFQPSWLPRRDLILAMDARNLADLRRMSQGNDAGRIRLFTEVGGLSGTRDIPDPWGGGPDEFGHVLDLLGAAAPVIVARLARLLETAPPE